MEVKTSENFLLTERLRNEDPEQFYTLVRMHLSFVLDLNADDCDGNSDKKGKAIIKWNLPFSKKQKFVAKNCSEGPILSAEFISQMKPVIEFLRKEENISQEGIFRRSGRVTRQQELKLLLHKGAELNFNENQFSVHECATVLKNVLSELPESVLTDAHYPAYCQIAEFCSGKNTSSNERLLRSLQLLILLLPNENRKFLQEIIELLHLAVAHESKNRMSADNLATLFTPHLLCPRKLSPEALHTNSQVMSRVVAFMIQKGSELFEIPPTVATDVRAYWSKKEKRKISPLKQMNESICDGTAANTVFTFVDRKKTAEENRTNPTETALAQLYAYIQSLPESSKKRKLIKQFNKENGHGTPLRSLACKKRVKTLNFSDSIKKHLTGFSRTAKRPTAGQGNHELEEELLSPDSGYDFKKIQNGGDEKSIAKTPVPSKNSTSARQLKEPKKELQSASSEEGSFSVPKESSKRLRFLRLCEVSSDDTSREKPIHEPSNNSSESPSQNRTQPERRTITLKRSSSSPVETLSSCKTNRLSNEVLRCNLHMTSRVSEDDFSPLTTRNTNFDQNFQLINNSVRNSSRKVTDNSEIAFGSENLVNNLKDSPRDTDANLCLNDHLECASFDNLHKAPKQKTGFSVDTRVTNNDSFVSYSNNTNRLPTLFGSKSPFLMTTSTPAPSGGCCLLTPIVDKNNSMSPITKSTKRMPKAMQETMMTPRSRKPVISLSGTNLCSLADSDSQDTDVCGSYPSNTSNSMDKKPFLDEYNEEVNDSLSSTFRNYLFSRSVLTTSPVDLSFSSRTDDFLSMSEKTSSEENEDYKSLPEMLNEAELSESLLYCLDGHEPEVDSEKNNVGYDLDNCSCSSFSGSGSGSGSDDNVRHIYETAL